MNKTFALYSGIAVAFGAVAQGAVMALGQPLHYAPIVFAGFSVLSLSGLSILGFAMALPGPKPTRIPKDDPDYEQGMKNGAYLLSPIMALAGSGLVTLVNHLVIAH